MHLTAGAVHHISAKAADVLVQAVSLSASAMAHQWKDPQHLKVYNMIWCVRQDKGHVRTSLAKASPFHLQLHRDH